MKTQKYFFILFLAIGCNVYGQFTAGIRAGGSYTNFLTKEQKYYKFIPGFHVGAYMEYDFAENLSFQTEVVYAKKGSNYKYSNVVTSAPPVVYTSVTDVKVKYDLAYIDVPLLLNIHFGAAGAYVGLGPQFSFLISSQSKGEIVTSNTASTNAVTSGYPSNKDTWSKLDAGLVFGLGSKFASGLEYCLRAGYGVSNSVELFKPINTDAKYHNLAFTVTIGYAFGEKSGSYTTKSRYKKKRRH